MPCRHSDNELGPPATTRGGAATGSSPTSRPRELQAAACCCCKQSSRFVLLFAVPSDSMAEEEGRGGADIHGTVEVDEKTVSRWVQAEVEEEHTAPQEAIALAWASSLPSNLES